MKANELSCKDLMIGDWVMINPISYYQVKQIRVEFGELRIYLKGTEVFATENEIMPVPLTPEILEKNGFKKQWQDNYEYFDDDENLNVTFHPKSSNYTNGAYDYIDIEKGCLTINEMPIMFVHQIQQALRLCGIEKTIEL